MAELRIGVSGWSYDDWRKGGFYPQGLPRKRELEYIGRQFNSAEINSSFYSLLKPDIYEKYAREVPDGFVFAVKGGRFITHSKKLLDVKTPLANFFASGVLRLEDRLGPVLWQFPRMAWDIGRVEAFLDLLPYDSEAASKLAKKHDQRVSGRASMAVHENRPIRHVLEFRHEHFLSGDVVCLCRERRVPLVFSHSGGDWPYTEEVTADMVYLRLHGAPHTYASPYQNKQLDDWAEKIRSWSHGGQSASAERITDLKPPDRKTRDVYVYFDNDQKAHAPHDARKLMEKLGVEAPGTWDDEKMTAAS